MAGLTTHYIFGLYTYKNLDFNDLKSEIKSYQKAFALGLQGPDIFYDFIPVFLLYSKNIAKLMHTQKSSKFFTHFIHNIKDINDAEESTIAKAFLYGFLGHYILDSNTHPMIYYRSQYLDNPKGYLGKHLTLEADIDKLMLKQYLGISPQTFRNYDIFSISDKEEVVINKLLLKTIIQTFPEVKLSMNALGLILKYAKNTMRIFIRPKEYGKNLIHHAEKLLFGCDLISPRFITDEQIQLEDPLNKQQELWLNPWNKKLTSRQTFIELFEQSSLDFQKLLVNVHQYINSGNNDQYVMKIIGNRSYHSGLSLH